MDRDALYTKQATLKQRYRNAPETALVTLRVDGTLGKGVTCHVPTHCGTVVAGLHPATGGDGTAACSGDMLLQALVACAGVTLSAVAVAMGITISSGQIVAEGDLDFRGTLGVRKDVPVGLQQIRLRIILRCDATETQQHKLVELTERYCVVYQTLCQSVPIQTSCEYV